MYAFLLGVCLLTGFRAVGQVTTEPQINGAFNDIKFKDFVKTIESQTDYYFYYDATQLDNLQIYIQVANQPLRAVLAQVFKDTEYTYAIDTRHRVYITKGTAIITQLPSDAASQEAISYAPPGEEQEKLLATAENKVYEVGPRKVRVMPGNSTVSGFVRNAVTGEPVIG